MGLEEYLASAGSLQPAFSTSTTKLSNFFGSIFSRAPTVRHPLNAQYTVLYERWSHVYIHTNMRTYNFTDRYTCRCILYIGYIYVDIPPRILPQDLPEPTLTQVPQAMLQ